MLPSAVGACAIDVVGTPVRVVNAVFCGAECGRRKQPRVQRELGSQTTSRGQNERFVTLLCTCDVELPKMYYVVRIYPEWVLERIRVEYFSLCGSHPFYSEFSKSTGVLFYSELE